GDVKPFQRRRSVATPRPEPLHRGGVLLWGPPEVLLHARRLLPGMRGDAFDGQSARGKRGSQQRAQAFALAPRACLNCLAPTPWQGPYPAMTGRPVDTVPGAFRQGRGRLEFATTHGKLRLGLRCAPSVWS